MTEQFTTYCVFDDASATRTMIKAGGGTVVSSKPMQVVDSLGIRWPGSPWDMTYRCGSPPHESGGASVGSRGGAS